MATTRDWTVTTDIRMLHEMFGEKLEAQQIRDALRNSNYNIEEAVEKLILVTEELEVSKHEEDWPTPSNETSSDWKDEEDEKPSYYQSALHSPSKRTSIRGWPVEIDPDSEESCCARMQKLHSAGKKVMVILQGCPGSGKSTLAQRILNCIRPLPQRGSREQVEMPGMILSTDDYWLDPRNGLYNWDPSRLPVAHKWNQERVASEAKKGQTPLLVDNTNIQAWEAHPYVLIALQYGYLVDVARPNHPWVRDPRQMAKLNKHGVPASTIRSMMKKVEGYSPKELIDGAYKSSGTAGRNLGQLMKYHCAREACLELEETNNVVKMVMVDDKHKDGVRMVVVDKSKDEMKTMVAGEHPVIAPSSPPNSMKRRLASMFPGASDLQLEQALVEGGGDVAIAANWLLDLEWGGGLAGREGMDVPGGMGEAGGTDEGDGNDEAGKPSESHRISEGDGSCPVAAGAEWSDCDIYMSNSECSEEEHSQHSGTPDEGTKTVGSSREDEKTAGEISSIWDKDRDVEGASSTLAEKAPEEDEGAAGGASSSCKEEEASREEEGAVGSVCSSQDDEDEDGPTLAIHLPQSAVAALNQHFSSPFWGGLEDWGDSTTSSVNEGNGMLVHLPLGLAEHLHRALCKSAQQSELDRQKKLKEMIACDEELARQLAMQEETERRRSSTPNQWAEQTETLAQKMGRQALLERFSGLDEEWVVQMYLSHDMHLSEATHAIEAVLRESGVEVRNNMQGMVGVQLSPAGKELLQKVTDYRRKCAEEEEEEEAELTCKDEDEGHHSLRKLWWLGNRQRARDIAWSQFANRGQELGMSSIAAQCATEARRCGTQVMQTHALAQARGLALSGAAYSEAQDQVDLHFLSVDAAVHHLEVFLDRRQLALNESGGTRLMIGIVTGRGMHSRGGRPKVKPAVKKFLFEKGIRYWEKNGGMLVAELRPRTQPTDPLSPRRPIILQPRPS